VPNAVRRVGGTGTAKLTYTLGPGEAFRLDACTFTINVGHGDDFITPTLIVKDAGGFDVAEIAAPSLLQPSSSFGPFAFSGPAVFGDDYENAPPGVYNGYLLHNFGAGIVTADLIGAYPNPPALAGGMSAVWLRAAGAATLAAPLGEAIIEDSASVMVTIQAPGVSAGDYLALHWSSLDDHRIVGATVPHPTASDSVGGNQLDFHDAGTYGYALASLQRSDGLWLNTGFEWWRVTNALPAGATVTYTPGSPPLWLQLIVHPISGLTVGFPVGPNAGGNYVGLGVSSAGNPLSTSGAPFGTPKWVGPVLINDLYILGSQGAVEVSMARGGLESQAAPSVFVSGATAYAQVALPELHLGPQDTLTAASFDSAGLRVEDLISDFLVWGVDE
jgi:hypothetical protein